jgi:hypothetical protein
VTNTGTLALGELRLDDPGLRLRAGDLTVLEGSLDATLAPGDRLVLVASVEAGLAERPRPRLAAVALDSEDDPVRTPVEVTAETPELDVAADESLPGFGEALSRGWRAFTYLVGVLIVILGATLPFLWLVPVLWLGGRYLRRRGERPAPRRGASTESTPPALPAESSGSSTPAEPGDEATPVGAGR